MLTVAGRRRSVGLSFEGLTLERFYTFFLVFLSERIGEIAGFRDPKSQCCLGFGTNDPRMAEAGASNSETFAESVCRL
jgi:hypothetical protein